MSATKLISRFVFLFFDIFRGSSCECRQVVSVESYDAAPNGFIKILGIVIDVAGEKRLHTYSLFLLLGQYCSKSGGASELMPTHLS